MDLGVWVRENGPRIVGSFIDNIYSSMGGILVRLRRSSGEPEDLVLSPGESVYITSRPRAAGAGAPAPFVMGFRKILRGSRILGIRQIPCERILVVEVERRGESASLIAELIPRGLVVAVDSAGLVRASTGSIEARDRTIRVGASYSYPPIPPSICGEPDVEKILRGYDIVRGLVIGANMPPDVAEEVLHRIGIDRASKPSEIGERGIAKILEFARSFVEEVMRSPSPGILEKSSGEPEGAYPYQPLSKIALGWRFRPTGTFNEALDEFYSLAGGVHAGKPPEVLRIERSVEKLRAQAEEARKELEALSRVLGYVEQNYQALEEAFECARKGYAAGCPSVEGSRLSGNRLEIPISGDRSYALDPRLSFMDNYIVLRKRVSELEKRISRSVQEISRLEEEAGRILSAAEERRQAEIISRRRRVEWYERYHWIITSEGLLAIGGMDAGQNEKIVRRYLRDSDIFIHADVQGGSAVVLIVDREYTHRSVEEAARIAACYSRAWRAGYGSVDVFYAKGSQVSKSPPPGEYLGRGAFMIYGERGWIRGVPLVLGIGVEVIQNSVPRIFVGPPELVASRAVVWSSIAPGDLPAEEAAEALLKIWAKRLKESPTLIKAVDVGEVVRRIPGRSRILPRISVPG